MGHGYRGEGKQEGRKEEQMLGFSDYVPFECSICAYVCGLHMLAPLLKL